MVKKFKNEYEKYQYYSSNNSDDDREWEENNKKFNDRLDNITENKKIYNKLIFDYLKEENLDRSFENLTKAVKIFGKYNEKYNYKNLLPKEKIKKIPIEVVYEKKQDLIFGNHDGGLWKKLGFKSYVDFEGTPEWKMKYKFEVPLRRFISKQNTLETKIKNASKKETKEKYNKELYSFEKEFYNSLNEKQKKYWKEFFKIYNINENLSDEEEEEEEEEIPKTRMKTKIVDNFKANERRRKRDEVFEHDKNLTDKKTIQRLIAHVMKNVSELPPPKPRKTKMKTNKIVEYIPEPEPEPVKKKRGRPPIPQEIKEQRKLEKAQKAKEERERKQEEKEYAEREFNRKQAGKIHAEKQYKENKIEYKKLKKYIKEENETGGVDKRTMNKYNDLKNRIKEYEDKYINNVV